MTVLPLLCKSQLHFLCMFEIFNKKLLLSPFYPRRYRIRLISELFRRFVQGPCLDLGQKGTSFCYFVPSLFTWLFPFIFH